jgi:hypothetical protein
VTRSLGGIFILTCAIAASGFPAQVGVLASGNVGSTRVSAASGYQITDLGAGNFPVDINDEDQVLLRLVNTPGSSTGVWTAGKTTQVLSPKNDASAQPIGINNAGVVIGDVSSTTIGYWNSGHSSRFVELSLAGLTFPDGKATAQAFATGIDNAGDVVGIIQDASGTEDAAFEIPGQKGVPTGKPTLVTSLGGTPIFGIAAINPPYLLSDVRDSGYWGNHLVVYDQATGKVTSTDLSYHHEGEAAFRDLTNQGSVAWVNNSLVPVVRKIGGTEVRLGPSQDDLMGPIMNDSGAVAGTLVNNNPYTTTPTFWDASGGQTALNSLPAVTAMGLSIQYMAGLNDEGNLVGTGTFGGTATGTHGFLLMHPKVTLSGTLRITDCGDNSCSRTGAKDEKVTVSQSGPPPFSTSTTTAKDGTWSVSVPPGTYTVTPPNDFVPNSATVVAKASVSGIDFAVCGEIAGTETRRLAASGQSGCPNSIDWKMENRTILAWNDGSHNPLGLTDKSTIYAPLTVSLNLTVGGSAVTHCSPTSVWKWSITSKPAGAKVLDMPKPVCSPFMQVSKQGDYTIVAKRFDGTRLRQTIKKTVTVKDLLILAMGDSNGSGEGDPPFYFDQCNRSISSYQYQAADLLQQQSHLHTSVTFVSASCSGARIQHLINTNYAGIRPGPALPPQIAQLTSDIAPPHGETQRPVDGVIISIGVNNIAFGPIMQYCIGYGLGRFGPHILPCEDSHVRAVLDSKGAVASFTKDNSSTKTLSDTIDRLVKALPQQYAALGSALSAANIVKPADVYITQYPAFYYGNNGTRCTATNSGVTGFDASTWHWLEGEANDLNTQVAHAARSEGWTLVVVPSKLFSGHGYCSSDPWFVGVVNAKANGNLAGAFHPTERGAHVSGVLVLEEMCDLLGDTKACKTFPTP